MIKQKIAAIVVAAIATTAMAVTASAVQNYGFTLKPRTSVTRVALLPEKWTVKNDCPLKTNMDKRTPKRQ